MFFPAEQSRARPARVRDRARDDARGRRPGAAPARPRRGPARAGRRPPGGASRPRRAHPGLRPDTGRRRYDARRRPSSRRPTRSARPTFARRPCTSRCAHDLSTSSSDYTDATIRLSRAVPGTAAARAAIADGRSCSARCALRRRGARRRADRQRAAPLRRDVERDDRHADGAGLGAEQPCARRHARDRDRGRRRCARLARALPRNPHAGRDQRRPRSGPCLGAAADHVRPRPPGPSARHRPRHAARRRARVHGAAPAAEGPS